MERARLTNTHKRKSTSAEPSFIALQGLRALAAIGVMSNHWSDELYVGLIPQQQLTIDFFFCVEGFLAATAVFKSAGQTKVWPLIWKRFLKIYPLYFIGLMAGIIAVAQSPLHLQKSEMALAASANLFLQPVFLKAGSAVFPFNPPTWAIVLELYAFALLCLLRKRLSFRGLFGVCAGAAVLYVGLVFILGRNPNVGWESHGYIGGFPRALFGFFGGIFLYHIIKKYGAVLPRINPLIVWGLFTLVLFLKIRFISIPFMLVGVPAIVWLGAVSTNPKWLAPLGRQAGRLAYGIYLLHFPILTAFRILADEFHLSKAIMASPLSYLVVLCSVIFIAYVVTYFIDEPLQRYWQKHAIVPLKKEYSQ